MKVHAFAMNNQEDPEAEVPGFMTESERRRITWFEFCTLFGETCSST